MGVSNKNNREIVSNICGAMGAEIANYCQKPFEDSPFDALLCAGFVKGFDVNSPKWRGIFNAYFILGVGDTLYKAFTTTDYKTSKVLDSISKLFSLFEEIDVPPIASKEMSEALAIEEVMAIVKELDN